MKILITGTAGFIGYHLLSGIANDYTSVTGLDSINDYYDLDLKYARLQESGIEKNKIKYNKYVQSSKFSNYRFIQIDLKDKEAVAKLFKDEKFDLVCHLAAQAGVRYSLQNPYAYIDSNITGFVNILEGCCHNNIKHLVFASSSSVYGLNAQMPFSVHHNVDHPISVYAASKKSNELFAHTYSYLYKIPMTGLRFFTVYGPWGRPDMAPILFTKAILENKPIKVFNNGNMERDFTYVDDIVEGLKKVIKKPPAGNPDFSGTDPDPASSSSPYKIYNIGYNSPVKLTKFIEAIEKNLNKKAEKDMMPLQSGDVVKTWADVSDLFKDFSYKPQVNVDEGIARFIDWYRSYYNQK